MSANRLLDLKLKCIFEFTELDHARAGQPVNTTATSLDDGKVIANESTSKPSSGRSNTSSSTTSNTSSSKDTYVNANDMSTANDFDSTAVSIKPSSQYTSNQKNTTTPAAAVAANTNNNNNSTTSSTAASRLEKNDNTLNELKQLKQENDSLKKEVARLKVTRLLSASNANVDFIFYFH